MPDTTTARVDTHPFIKNVHGVRYHVKDVDRSVTFYTRHVGFKLEHQQLPAFASVSLGDSQVISALKTAGLRFRNELETGPGGRQNSD